MFHQLHSSPSSQGYKPLGSEVLGTSALTPELSSHGGHADAVQPFSRSNTMVATKSFGDLRATHGRARGKKTRAMKWLVLGASGDRQVFTLDKRQLIQACRLEIPIRDMRLMDSALGTETLAQLLVRDNALVFSMEHVRLIIMHDKVVMPLDDCGLQPPAPPGTAPLPTTPAPERLGPASASQEVKDRFLSHLEGVVMDWALQHGAALAGGTASPAPPPSAQAPQAPTSNGGGGVAAAAVAAHSHSEPQQTGNCGKGPVLRCAGAATGPGAAGTAAGAALHGFFGAMGAAGHSAAGAGGGGPGSETASTNAFDPEYQPFEMLVLETALSEICTHLSREVDALQVSCQPALEALMKTADTANLEAVRRIKTQHARLVTRVTATREALARLMEDDDDMIRMCLTQQAHMRLAAVAAAAAAAAQQQHSSHNSSHQHSYAALPGSGTPAAASSAATGATPPAAAGAADAASDAAAAAAAGGALPDTPPSPSRTEAHQLAMLMGSSLSASYIRPASLAARAVRHQVAKKPGCLGEALAEAAAVAAAAAAAAVPGSGGVVSGGAAANEVAEHDFLDVENLLESYAIIVDTTYQTLMSIGEYIDDTEDLINIQLDYSRNKLIRFDILLTAGTFALAFFNIVTGMLGENLVLPDTITQDLSGFMLVNGGTLLFCISTFLSLVAVFKWQKVL